MGEAVGCEALIAKIPVKEPWELPLWVPMGGFDFCPYDSKQAAVFRLWWQRYGAVPMLVRHDTWLLRVSRPPETDADCEALAKEMSGFDYMLPRQADALRGAGEWWFWWDWAEASEA